MKKHIILLYKWFKHYKFYILNNVVWCEANISKTNGVLSNVWNGPIADILFNGLKDKRYE